MAVFVNPEKVKGYWHGSLKVAGVGVGVHTLPVTSERACEWEYSWRSRQMRQLYWKVMAAAGCKYR